MVQECFMEIQRFLNRLPESDGASHCFINGGQKDMDRYIETFHTWNNIAMLYQEKFMDMDLYHESYDFFCNAIDKPNSKILEIGCGPGNITRYLLSKRPNFDIFGIDIAPRMIELARENNPTAHFATMDCRDIQEIDSKFDGLIGGFCLPYLSQSESKELLHHSYHLLREGGVLYLSFVEGDPEKSDFKQGSGGRVYFNYHDLHNISAHLTALGFELLKTFKVPYKISETDFDIHTIVTARKTALRS